MQISKFILILCFSIIGNWIYGAVSDSTPVEILRRVDQLPSFPGGQKAMLAYIAENLNVPISSPDHKIIGQAIVQFVVFKDGEIGNVKMMKSLDPMADREAQRLVKNMPKWIPGKHHGEPVNVEMGLPILFDYLAEAVFDKEGNLIITGVDEPAKFPGGQSALLKYIGTNLKYPIGARNNKIQGDVVAQFIIDKDGSVVSPTIVSGLGHGIDEELISVLSTMPKWKPSKVNGQAVRTMATNLKVVMRIY